MSKVQVNDYDTDLWLDKLRNDEVTAERKFNELARSLLADGFAPISVHAALKSVSVLRADENDEYQIAADNAYEHHYIGIEGVCFMLGGERIANILKWIGDNPPEWMRDTPFPKPSRGSSQSDWLWRAADISRWCGAQHAVASTNGPSVN